MEVSLKKGLEQQQLAMDLMETNNDSFIESMRSVARMMCRARGAISTDDLRIWFDMNQAAKGIPSPTSNKVWGTIFKSKDFVQHGFTRSRIPHCHGRMIMTWKLA